MFGRFKAKARKCRGQQDAKIAIAPSRESALEKELAALQMQYAGLYILNQKRADKIEELRGRLLMYELDVA